MQYGVVGGKFQEPDEVTSILCEPENAPITYHWYYEPPELNLVQAFFAILAEAGVTGDLHTALFGEFRQRLDQAGFGSLRPIAHIKGPMDAEKRHLDIFEIVFDWDLPSGEMLHVRIYHAEPKALQSKTRKTVVGLHIHRKIVAEGEDINALQDAEIAKAVEKYMRGVRGKWGL